MEVEGCWGVVIRIKQADSCLYFDRIHWLMGNLRKGSFQNTDNKKPKYYFVGKKGLVVIFSESA